MFGNTFVPGGGQPGLPMGLSGAVAATRYVGGTTSGAPTSGTFAIGDFVIDQKGNIWICTVAGSPGTWIMIGNGPVQKNIIKQGDTTVNNSTVLINDPELQFPIAASESWFIMLALIYNSGATPNFKWAFQAPAGAVGSFSGLGIQVGQTAYTLSGPFPVGGTGTLVGAGVDRFSYIFGIVINGVNAGTFNFQFAQNTANASNTICRTSSAMLVTRR